MNDPLLGGHNEILEDLLRRVRAIGEGEYAGPNIILLRGASGVGKSRIIRDLYATLAESPAPEGGPRYWSSLPGVDRVRRPADPMPARKELGPRPDSFIWGPGVLPRFGWWALQCAEVNGVLIDPLGALKPQLDVHALPVAIAQRKASSVQEKFAKGWDLFLREIQSAAKDEAVGIVESFLGQAFNVALPGLGSLLNWGMKGAGATVDLFQEQQQLSKEILSGGLSVQSGGNRAAEVARDLRALSHASVPGIVVIEDLHWMPSSFAHFLKTAAEYSSSKPMLVIATVWPEGFDNPAFSDWYKDADSKDYQLIDVPNLDDDDLIKIVRSCARNTTVDDARAIVTRLNTPHFLKLWLTTDRVEKLISKRGGALIADEALISSLPKDIHNVLEMRWAELPRATQDALSMALAAQPDEQNGPPQFIPEIISGLPLVGKSPGDAHAAQLIQDGLDFAIDPAAWCHLSNNVAAFREESLQRIVQSHISDPDLGWDQEVINGIRAAAVDVLVEWISKHAPVLDETVNLDGVEIQTAAEWLTSLGADGTTYAHGIASLALTNHRRSIYAHYDAIAYLQQALEILEPHLENSEFRISLYLLLAELFGQVGDLDTTIDLLKELLVEVSGNYDNGNHSSLLIRLRLAAWLADSGQAAEAVEQLQILLDDQKRALGNDHVQTLATRSHIANCKAQLGQIDEAVKLFNDLLQDQSRFLGVNHRETLGTRGSIILYSKEFGDPSKIEDLRTLLVDRIRVLGADHPHTLGTRRDIANALAESGQLSEALQQDQAVLVDQIRIIGRDHPETLMTRGNLVIHKGLGGGLDEAICEIRELIKDKTRVLGAKHPDTLDTRANLAAMLQKAGTSDQARDELIALHESQVEVLGINHPSTLRTQEKLIPYLAAEGTIQDANVLASLLLDTRQKVLGDKHPDTLQAQRLLDTLNGRLTSSINSTKMALLHENADAVHGALLRIGVQEDGSFNPIDCDQFVSWKTGETTFTIFYSSQAMILFEDDRIAGVAPYSQPMLQSRATDLFTRLTGELRPELAEGIL